MSFNRLNYDTCSYKQSLAESIGSCEYQLGTPQSTCTPCFNKDPRYRLQRNGVSLEKRQSMIDIDSELLNIVRDASNCSQKKHVPTFTKDGDLYQGDEKLHFEDCNMITTEDTRLSNPACNLRGTGWNRWEWLCIDPQERVLIPFDYVINTQLVVRDNHRPCIPTPLDQALGLPTAKDEPIVTNIESTRAAPTGPASVQWRDARTVRNY